MRLFRHTLPMLCSFTLVGCLDSVSPAPERAAFFDVTALTDDGVDKLRVRGAFFRASGLGFSFGTLETCEVFAFNPVTGAVGAPTVSGGLAVDAQVAGGTTALARVQTGNVYTYEMARGSELTYTPGDTLTLTIPGDPLGFPAATARIRTSEAFTSSPIVPPASGQPLILTWSAPSVSGSLMTLSLRYSNNDLSTVPDVEIYCVFADDGSASIPANFADAWAVASPNARSYVFSRVRESSVTIANRTMTRLFSFYSLPLPDVEAGPIIPTLR